MDLLTHPDTQQIQNETHDGRHFLEMNFWNNAMASCYKSKTQNVMNRNVHIYKYESRLKSISWLNWSNSGCEKIGKIIKKIMLKW